MARRKTLTINGLEIYSNANGDPSTVTKCSREGGREGEGGRQITSPKSYFSKIYVLISNNKLLQLLGSLPK